MKKKVLLAIIFLSILFIRPVWEEDLWIQSLNKMSAMVSLIDAHHFQSANNEELVNSSIKGMLSSLDPHSYFLDMKDFSTLTEDYKGKYYGLGIMIQKHGDLLKVIAPLEGTPAYLMGVQPGDVISHIEGESTKPISSYNAMQKLRGKKGTKVTITLVREGSEAIDMTFTRAEIPLHSVTHAFILRDDIGYIYIRNFAETTTEEFHKKMELLQDQGMKKLILDFRLNGGGTFIQSLEICEEFLPKGSTIVSIKGRNKYYNREFRATKNGQYEDIPLVIVIHQGTASAPEIVSGAVKDNDRGIIVGEKSWGKGLVQTVFRLSRDTAVALTTAKYYTPSGRSIQRDYSSIEDYLSYQEVPEEEREVHFTSEGRKVLGQGGITPDYEVKFSYKPMTYRLLLKGAFFSYARKFNEKKTSLGKQMLESGPIPKPFKINTAVLEDFQQYIQSIAMKFEPEDFQKAKEQIIRELEREMVASFWGREEGEKAFRLSDPVIQKAFTVFSEAEQLALKD